MRRRAPAVLAGLLVLVLAGAARAHVPHDVAHVVAVSPDYAQDGTIFATMNLLDLRVFSWSDDRGRTWRHAGHPMAFHDVFGIVFSPAWAADATAFAHTSNGVYRTEDRGTTWTRIGAGQIDPTVRGLAVSPDFARDGLLVAATSDGVFRSDDRGDAWTEVTAGLTESAFFSAAAGSGAGGGPVFFCGGLTVHRSDDGGLTWTAQATMPSEVDAIDVSPGFAADASAVLALRTDGVRTTTDGGALWRIDNSGLTELLVTDVAYAQDGTLFATTRDTGVFRADGVLAGWSLEIDGFEELDGIGSPHYRDVVTSPDFGADGTVVVAAHEGIHASDDGGSSWTQFDTFHQRSDVRLAVSPDYPNDHEVYAGNYGGGVFLWREPFVGGPPGGPSGPGEAGPSAGGALVAGPAAPAPVGRRVVSPPPPPGGWEPRSTDLRSLWADALSISPAFAADDTIFYGFAGVYRTEDRGGSWVRLDPPPSLPDLFVVRDIGISPDFANDRTIFLGTNAVGVYKSIDAGESWTLIDDGLTLSMRTRQFVFSRDFATDGTVFVGTWDDGVMRSTDGGESWVSASAGLTPDRVGALAISPDFPNDAVLICGMRSGGLFRTQDAGTSWSSLDLGLSDDVQVITAVAFSPDVAEDGLALAAESGAGLFRSEDGGFTWTATDGGLPLSPIREIVFSPGFAEDRTVFAATHEGLWRSFDAGRSWIPAPTWVRVDDIHPTVSVSPGWTEATIGGGNGKGTARSLTPGASRTALVLARTLCWIAVRGPDAAIVELTLDDQPPVSIDLYAEERENQVPVWTAAFGEAAWHTVTVVHTGTANPASSGTVVESDGFVYDR